MALEAGILRRRVFVEETVRLTDQHLETSGQPDSLHQLDATAEIVGAPTSLSETPVPTASNAPETVLTTSNTPETVSKASEAFPVPPSSSTPETTSKSCSQQISSGSRLPREDIKVASTASQGMQIPSLNFSSVPYI